MRQDVRRANAIAGSERSAVLRLICPGWKGPEFQDVTSWNFGTQKVEQVSYQAADRTGRSRRSIFEVKRVFH